MKSLPTRFAAYLLGSLCTIVATNCGSDEREQEGPAPERVQVRYAQTQCGDRWGAAGSPQALVTAAQNYLHQQGLTLHQPQASRTSQPAVCAACTCPTGLVLEGAVAPADVSAVLALGFTKK